MKDLERAIAKILEGAEIVPVLDDEGREETQPLAEAVVMDLQELAGRYAAGCPFKPGDLVQPRRGYCSRWERQPHIVLEVLEKPLEPSYHDSEPSHSSGFGRRIDMRVALLTKDGISPFWVESWTYQPFLSG